jgi:hypothetical protein
MPTWPWHIHTSSFISVGFCEFQMGFYCVHSFTIFLLVHVGSPWICIYIYIYICVCVCVCVCVCKVVPVLSFSWTPRHEGVLRKWKHSSMHFWTRHYMEMSGQLHAPAALPQGKSPWYPLDRRLGGPLRPSGHGGEEKNSQPLSGLEPPIIQPVAQSYTLSYPGSIYIYIIYVQPTCL